MHLVARYYTATNTGSRRSLHGIVISVHRRFTTDIWIADNERGSGVVSRRAIPISSSQSRDPIAHIHIALPELNGDRVRTQSGTWAPSDPSTRPSVHLSIKSDHNYMPYSDTVGTWPTEAYPLSRELSDALLVGLIYEISCIHHEFPCGAHVRTYVSRQSRYTLDRMSIIKRSRHVLCDFPPSSRAENNNCSNNFSWYQRGIVIYHREKLGSLGISSIKILFKYIW